MPAPARPAPPVPGGQREHASSQSSGHHHGRGRERGMGSSAGAAQQRGPQQIGDYDLVKTLGTGSFGKVKRECSAIAGCTGASRKDVTKDSCDHGHGLSA